MEDLVEGSVLASKTLDAGKLEVIRKHIECGTGNMVVNPVNRTSITGTRVSFQVVNPHTSGWPCRDSKIAAIQPDFAPLDACRRQMDGYDECFLARNGSGLVGETVLRG